MRERKQVEIKKLGINGEGIGYINKKIIFIKGALPLELVEVEIVKSNRNYYEGKLIKIINPSINRITPTCNQNESCQGCSLLHLDYHQQLQFKKDAILESIHKYTKYHINENQFLPVIGSDQKDQFTQVINLPVVKVKNRLTFGIYQRDTKYLTLLNHCMKYQKEVTECLDELEMILNDNHVKLYQDREKTGLRFLKLKCIDKQIQLVFITGKDELKESVLNQIAKIKHVKGVFLSVNTTRYQDFDQVGYRKIAGYTRLPFIYNNETYQLSIKAKIPENIMMMAKKLQAIKSLLLNSKRILSLYSGNGLLELGLDGYSITALDDKNYHIEDSKLNAKLLNKDHVRFIGGDVNERVVTYAKKKTFDAFVIQTDRFPLSNVVKESIILSKVPYVIYVSNSHSTMAKDLADIEKYYYLEKIIAVDEYVYTPYVTTIVKLKRK